MPRDDGASDHRALAILHPAFALTGVLHAIGGPLMPSLAASFHLHDKQSGLLFFLYFAGTSLGAVFCRGNYARNLFLAFVGSAVCCFGVAWASPPLLPPLFLLLGISVGDAMSAVSLYSGRNFPERCAPILTALNFTWSIGAFAAPVLAAQVLTRASYRMVYTILAAASALAALYCGVLLRDGPGLLRQQKASQNRANVGLILGFAVAAFLQVGIENTAAAWLSTYALRMTGAGVALAAAASSFYWVGFLGSRGLSSFVLLRLKPKLVFRLAVAVGFVAGIALAVAASAFGREIAMLLLGAALAPIYPLVIAGSFASIRQTADSRWVLATAGFGGSVLPWLAGWISSSAGGMRAGMLTIPAAILLMAIVMLVMSKGPGSRNHEAT
ncbi:MAG TPA: MFS transporter [Terracidiphilus sp.]|nr:MFS transporter [Terracidiphilus sp.]